MSTLRISSGLNTSARLPETLVVLVGRRTHLKALDFNGSLATKLHGVSENVFAEAVKQLPADGGVVPIYLNLAKLVAVKDDVSRNNTPSNSVEIFKNISALVVPKEIKSVNIVVYADYAHVMASVAAVARSFPLFQRKAKNNELKSVDVEVVVTNGKSLSDSDLKFLQTLCDSIRQCARQVDTPCNELNSEKFAEEAIQMVDGLNCEIKKTIIKGEELLKQGFGGIYSVGKAANSPPIFLCFSYSPEGSTENYAFVGKGIVYDTGGLSLKPSKGMESMKMDMGGAAGLLGAFCTLIKSGFKEQLHCILCIAENHISPASTKPGDVIKLLSGKFVEVNNTDAEGRLVMSDGIYYAKEILKAKTIIEMATLTGAQQFATGHNHAAILCNTDEFEQAMLKAGKASGDLVHPLPYTPELHFADFKSIIADMKNACGESRQGPPSANAGLFVFSHIDFAKDVNWIHIDCAFPTFVKGRATGYGVPLVCSLLAKHTDVEIAKHN